MAQAPDAKPAVLYFAYGSNMSSERTARRVRKHGPLAPGVAAHLAGFARAFDKAGTKGGKTNIKGTGQPRDAVPGVAFSLTPAQFDELAAFEEGYDAVPIRVRLGTGEEREAVTFVAKERTAGLRPSRTYLGHLIRGAREHGFSAAEIKAIEETPTEG